MELSVTPDGAELLNEVERFVSRFVAYPSAEACTAHVLWIGHTHFMDQWESTPRLLAVSEEPSSGKSRLLEITEHLVPKGVIVVGPSESYLFRKIAEDVPPTLLFDEIDTVFGPKAPTGSAEGIRRMLNAGHRKGAKVGRTVVGNGKPYTEDLSAYCAVAMAGLLGRPLACSRPQRRSRRSRPCAGAWSRSQPERPVTVGPG
jgi:hypothetical protein